MKLAWLGLGAMGRPMAAHLAGEHETVVWNRTSGVAKEHAGDHGTVAVADLEETAAAEVVFSCLPTTAVVADVAARLAPHLRDGTLWVDCTSGEPAPSRDLAARLGERGIGYVDAPVSGGTDGAEAGTLTVMAGGSDDHVERVRPLLGLFGARVVHVGPVGAGHAVKAVNNTLLAANLWSAGEGLAALVKQGVDAATALEVINGSSGRSFVTERLVPERVVTREWPVTFALGLLAKDARIGNDVLDDAGVPGPVLRLVRALTDAAEVEVGADADHAELIRVVERWADAEIR